MHSILHAGGDRLHKRQHREFVSMRLCQSAAARPKLDAGRRRRLRGRRQVPESSASHPGRWVCLRCHIREGGESTSDRHDDKPAKENDDRKRVPCLGSKNWRVGTDTHVRIVGAFVHSDWIMSRRHYGELQYRYCLLATPLLGEKLLENRVCFFLQY